MAAAPSFAQSATGELRPGASVRVRADPSSNERMKGTLLSATRDSLVLVTDDRNVVLARRDVRTLEVKRRRARSSGALRLATWVGVISAAVFAPSSLGADEYTCGSSQCEIKGGDFSQIMLIGFSAAVYGQVIGALWPGKEWLPVTPSSSTVGHISPPTQGSRVRITAPGYTAPDFEGVVATSTADSLVLLVRKGVVSIPTTAVTHIEYANGSNVGKGAVRGLMQAVPAAGIYLATGLREHTTITYRNGVAEASDQQFVSAMLVGAAVSAAIGAGLGALIAPPQWDERRTSTSLLVSPDIQHRAMRVGLTLRY